ncbi:unnamed protein product [Staurois parvus]|uniref:Uncharacterized protein n=1 Tax=Staurois parvus TaxID=386267 RepID=A0ABN9FDE8_9NEOB|nr:unnamed protein product [Staurois parvus]
MGPPGAIGDHGAPVSLLKLKKAYEKRYQGHLMGPPTDPGPSGSALVSKWSVRPWVDPNCQLKKQVTGVQNELNSCDPQEKYSQKELWLYFSFK